MGSRCIVEDLVESHHHSANELWPGGATAWLLKTVSRKPLRYVLALLLEPLFRKGLNKAFGRYAKENNETTAK